MTGRAGRPLPVVLPQQIHDAMVAHARFAFPEEACGLLATDGHGALRMVYCTTNIERSTTRFTVDPTEHFRAMRHAERNGWEIGGSFHSHPTSPAFPSPMDIAGALEPAWVYLIVGLARPDRPEVRAFRITGGDVAERPVVETESW